MDLTNYIIVIFLICAFIAGNITAMVILQRETLKELQTLNRKIKPD